ncbi:unnamed protein product [Miscanthus lutarioriparius]|uniref:Squalene cyclase C-terminal domain-containing protein n=1 Tax=Miscanthus lutarioriparius TaxID=422564 RepID=A0A811PT23_9POAL|nr:unnamed protein product [Miscanthus lutarioriparius]
MVDGVRVIFHQEPRWTASFIKNQAKECFRAYTNLDREKSHIVNSAWAMLALMKAGQVERDPTPLHKAARLIMSMQLGNGDFPQEVTAKCPLYYTIHILILTFPVIMALSIMKQ